MTSPKRLLSAAAVAVVAVSLAGCISLFPKSKPAQLYRLDAPAPAAEQSPASVRVGVLKPGASFARAIGGDRMLGLTGAEAAYIADARWVAPAAVLFDEAVARAFDANTGQARLVTRGEVANAHYILRLDVRNFEAVYENGRDASPVVVMRMRAVMTRTQTREVVGEKLFEASVPAGANRVTAIVGAFNRATGQVVTELVAWTNGLATPPT